MTLVVPADQPTPRAWRGGRTWEIGRDPADADYPDGHYRLWVGTATIERSADYSYFANAERLHVLLRGDGLRLHFREPDDTIDLATHQACTFSGERPLHAELLGAPVTAFNLVYRTGMRSGAEFVRLTGTHRPRAVQIDADAARTQIVHVLSGRVVLERSGEQHLLNPGDTVLWEIAGPSNERLDCRSRTDEAELLLAYIADAPAAGTASP